MANQNQTGGNADKSKQQSGSGNFADDPKRASEAGKKGGQHSHDGSASQSHQSGSGRSQQNSVPSDDADDSDDSGKGRGSKKNQR
jgi:general stress protein YciG